MEVLSGMPGTMSDDAKRIRWHKHDETPLGRRYTADIADGQLRAMVSRDETQDGLLWHISVSHWSDGKPDRVPTWDELKHAYYSLVPADVPMVLIFPRKSTPKEKYVNVTESCLHLWEQENVDQ